MISDHGHEILSVCALVQYHMSAWSVCMSDLAKWLKIFSFANRNMFSRTSFVSVIVFVAENNIIHIDNFQKFVSNNLLIKSLVICFIMFRIN